MSIVIDPDTGEILGEAKTLEDRTNGHSGPKPGRLREQLTLEIGGEEPTASLIRFTGSLPLGGEYEKGDVVRFEVVGRIASVAVKDVEDKHGQIVGTERVHAVKLSAGGPA